MYIEKRYTLRRKSKENVSLFQSILQAGGISLLSFFIYDEVYDMLTWRGFVVKS